MNSLPSRYRTYGYRSIIKRKIRNFNPQPSHKERQDQWGLCPIPNTFWRVVAGSRGASRPARQRTDCDTLTFPISGSRDEATNRHRYHDMRELTKQ